MDISSFVKDQMEPHLSNWMKGLWKVLAFILMFIHLQRVFAVVEMYV